MIRRPRVLLSTAAVFLLLWVFATTTAADALTADELCVRADEWLEVAELQAAKADFAAAAGAGAACGTVGQRTVTELEGDISRLLMVAGGLAANVQNDPQEINDMYLMVLAIDRQNQEARTALTSRGVLADQCVNAYQGAHALLDAGYRDEARIRAQEILKDSSACPIPDELDAPNPLGVTNGLVEAGSQVERWVTAIGQFLLAFVAVSTIGGLLVAVGFKARRHYPGSRKVQLVIGTITGPKAHEDLGPDVVQILSTELAFTSSYAASMTSIGEGSTDLGSITGSLPDQVKFIGPAIDWIRRPVRFNLNGRLVHVEEGRVILNLVLTDERGKTIAARRFDRTTLGNLTAARAAGIEAAAWLAFQVLELQYPRKPADTHRSILGSTSWASYASIRLARLAGEKEWDKLLDKALFHDRRNVAALREVGYKMTGDAVPSIGTFDRDKHTAGLRYIKAALDRLAATESLTHGRRPLRWLTKQARFDPLWYQTMYAAVIAQAHGYSADEDGAGAERLLHDAISDAVELTRAVGHTQRALRSWILRYVVSERQALGLQAMFDRDGAYLAGVLAGVLTSYRFRETNPDPKKVNRVDLPTGPVSPPIDESELWDKLARVASWPEWKANEPRPDPPFNVLATAQYLHAAVSAADARGSDVLAYNRACTFARGRMLHAARRELLASLDHLDEENLRYTIESVEVDPALGPLLDDPKLGPQVRAELKKRKPPDPEVREKSATAQQSRWTVEIFA